MKTLDELVADKLLDLVEYALLKVIKPDITAGNVCELDADAIEKLKQEYGIEGMIIDVDNTLRKEMRSIPKCNLDWLESLNGKLKVVILSNGIDKKIENYFTERGIRYIGFANKPFKKNFMKACEHMNLPPEKILVVGDSAFDDIYGAKRCNMKTLLVKGVEENER